MLPVNNSNPSGFSHFYEDVNTSRTLFEVLLIQICNKKAVSTSRHCRSSGETNRRFVLPLNLASLSGGGGSQYKDAWMCVLGV